MYRGAELDVEQCLHKAEMLLTATSLSEKCILARQEHDSS